MSAIPASSYTCRMLVDGTLAMTIHFEPANAQDAFKLFGAPGTAMALAALKSEPAKREKLGPLCEWAVMRCKEPQFQQWCGNPSEVGARFFILNTCDIDSRKELDGTPEIEARFHHYIRQPYSDWMKSQ